MRDIENLYFEQLKKHIQAQYLKNHTPSFDEISKWKGIDIIYFQEDLRKIAKGNISEKSFYTYFKTSDNVKVPRIDMLNILSVYVGYDSWNDFKRKNEIFQEDKEQIESSLEKEMLNTQEIEVSNAVPNIEKEEESDKLSEIKSDLQKIVYDNQVVDEKNRVDYDIPKKTRIKDKLWIILSILFGILAGILGFKDEIFGKTYTYCFADADRSSGIRSNIQVKVFKQNESPLIYKIKPGECFYYHTKDANLTMEISSPFYENIKVTRSLENAPQREVIDLNPDDYKFAFYYFSLKDVSGNSKEIINQKRRELENRISDNAVIKQIYDSDIYGVETISKEKYITLVTTPTTSLKNLNLLEMKRNDKGKIISIKFKINDNEIK